nr:hypothetical protein [Tanacetum cinerariifolium]
MENIQKIIKEKVKEQVKVQVSKILPKIEKTVNEQIEVEVLTRASNSSMTSYDVAADLSELELKKILIEKMESTSLSTDLMNKGMESNKSIHQSDEQRNLYKALVNAYEYDKIILDTYRDTVTLKRRHDDEVKVAVQLRSDRLRDEAQAKNEDFLNKLDGKYSKDNKGESQRASQDTVTLKRRHDDEDKDEEPSARSDRGSKRRQAGKEPESTSAPKEKASKTSGKSTKSRKYTNSVTKTKAADYGHIKWIEDLVPRTMWSQAPVSYDTYALCEISHWGRKRQQFYGFSANRESARDVYSKRRIIAVTELQIIEWHNYKHLDWITMHRDNDKLYKFK